MTHHRAQTLTRPTNHLEHDDTPDQWWQQAACHGRDPAIWEEKARIGEAKKICADCPVKAMCVKDALDAEDFWHTRAGLTGDALRKLARGENHRSDEPFPTTRPERMVRITAMLDNGYTRAQIVYATQLAVGTIDDYLMAIRTKRGLVKTRGPVECGTYQGYRRHFRAGTPACDPCRRANAAYSARNRAKKEAS